jgi:hypothetical protein
MDEGTTLLFQVAAGIALAACAGLRAFLPLFLVGLAGRFEWLPLSETFSWLGSGPALIIFGVAVGTEVLGDKIPIVDHVLDLLQTVVRPVAGVVLAAAVLTDLTPLQTAVLAILLGGATATAVHATKVKLRILSSTTTVGLANPLISLAEDILAFVGTLLAIVIPLLVVAFVAAGLVVVILGIRRFQRRAAEFGR